jgi:hypothetical protein
MKIVITTRAVLDLPLTTQQVDALITLSQHHYDGRCRMASGDDGFLTGWRGQIVGQTACGATDISVSASMHEADTCLKLLEMRHLAERSALVDKGICDALNRDLCGATSLANSKFTEWQATYGK